MEQEKHYRHELKYPVSYTDYKAVRERLRQIMKPDPHTGADGTYRTRTIYFDNSDDKALKEKVAGIAKREKFRIRYVRVTFDSDIRTSLYSRKFLTGEAPEISATDRPQDIFDALLENEEYLEKYHEYLRRLVEEYVYGGRFEEVYNRIRSQIDTLVETDPTAFYTYEKYLVAADMLKEVVELRAESIRGQLDGTIPSTDSAQKEDDSSYIDASHLDLDLMGSMNMGGGEHGPGNDDRQESSADGP